MQDDSGKIVYPEEPVLGDNSIPTQTFSANDSAGVTPEDMLKRIKEKEASLADQTTYDDPEVGKNSSRLFGRSVAQVFAISAILIIILIGVAVFGVLDITHNAKDKPTDSTGILSSLKGALSQNPLDSRFDNSGITINRDTTVGGKQSFTTTGDVLVQSTVNSDKAFRIQNAAGNNLLVADTVKGIVTVNGTVIGGTSLSVNGDLTSVKGAYSLTDQGLSLGGVLICTSRGCTSPVTPQTIDQTNLAHLASSQTFSGINRFTSGSNVFVGDGSGLSALSADNVTSGTLSDARLSGNVALKNGNQTFSGNNVFGQQIQANNGVNVSTFYSVGGVAGLSLTCAPGDLLQQPTLSGGIITSASCVTGAGASVATLQQSYDASIPATITLSAASGPLKLDDAGSPLAGNLFEVSNNSGLSNYFAVKSTGISVTGNVNITGQYQVSGLQISSSNLSDGPNLAKLNAGQTFTGANIFSNASNSFTGSGAGLTTLNASNISSGTLNDARLSANVGLLSANQTFTGSNTFSNAGNSFTGSGAGLTSLNGSNISSGTVNDARLSANVALLNANNVFTGNDAIHLNSTAFTVQDAASPLGADLFTVTDNAGTTKYFSVSATGAKIGADDICTTAGNCVGAGGGVTTVGGSIGKIAKFTGSQTIADSLLSESGSTVTVGGTLAVNTITPTATLTVGTPSQTLTLQGDGSTSLSATVGGIKNSLVFAAPTVTNKTITLPDANGTVAVSATGPLALDAAGNLTCPTCLTSGGGGGTSGVISINTLSGALTVAGTANQITVTPSGGNTLTLSLPQDIAISSTPTFANINVGAGGQFRINGSQISSSALSNDANLAKLNGNQTFTGTNTFSNAGNSFTGDGSGLSSLNASNVSSGTLDDARLSGNVPLKDAANTFSNTNLFSVDSATAFQVQNATTSDAVLTADTTGGKVVLGTSSSLDGNLQFLSASGSGSISLIANDPSSTDYVLNLPAENGTLCSTGSICAGYASSGSVGSGLAGKLNKDSVDTSTAAVTVLQGNLYAFTNSSSALASGVLSLDNGTNTNSTLVVTASGNPTSGQALILANNTNGSASGNLIDLQNNGSSEFSVDASGNVSASGNLSIASGKQYQINGIQISSADLSNDANLAKLGAGQTFTGANVFSNAGNSFSGDGSGLTNLNATNVTSGTLGDGRLSSNVPLKNAANTFTNTNTIAATSATTFQIQNSGAADTLFTADTTARGAGGGNLIKIGNSTGTDTNTTFLVVDSASANPTSNLGALNGGLFYNSGTDKLSIIENGTVKELCNKTDLGCGAAGTTPTLATVYSSGSVSSDSIISLDSTRAGVLIKDNASPIASTLFGVQNSTGAAKYLDVTASGISVAGTVTASGNINTVGGIYEVNSIQISSADLSNNANLAKLNGTGPQTFTGNNKFTGTVLSQNASNSTTAFQIQDNAGTSNLFVADTTNTEIGIGKTPSLGTLDVNGTIFQSGNQVCDTGGNCVGVGGGAIGGSGTAGQIALFTGSGYTVGDSNLAQSGSVVTATGDLNVTGQYKVGGTQISSANLSNDSNLAKLNGTGPQTFTGDNKFSGTVLSANTSDSTAAFQIQNSSTTALLTADTTNMRIGVNVTYTQMSVPASLVSVNHGSGSGGAGVVAGVTYYYKVTAVDSLGGETSASNETSTLADSFKIIDLSWTAVTGASGYNIYRSASTGAGSGGELYIESVRTNSFQDNGRYDSLNSVTPPPGSNTAYTSTNSSNNLGQLVVGGLGAPTGQLYVSGISPKLLSVNPLMSGVDTVYVQGNYLYVLTDLAGTSNHKFTIYDVSNPASPLLTGGVDIGTGGGTGLVVQGSYAYVDSGDADEFDVIDVSNPAAPVIVGTSNAGLEFPREIAVSGRYAYVVNSDNNNLVTFDVGDPTNPVITSTIFGGGSDYARIKGHYLYTDDVNKYDISVPANPVYVGVSSDYHDSAGVVSQGRYHYSLDINGLDVIDVSNSANPVSVASTFSGLSSPDWLVVSGRYVYVSNYNPSTLAIYDLGGAYIQQLETGGIKTDSLSVSGNTDLNGNTTLNGGLTVVGNIELQGTGGINLAGSANISGSINSVGGNTVLATPAAPTVTPVCVTSCTHSATYKIVALDAYGGASIASPGGSTNTSSSSLTATHYNTVSWTSVPGAFSYRIYRTATSGIGGNGSTHGSIDATTSTSYDDIGNRANNEAAPTASTANGQLYVVGDTLLKSNSSVTGFQVQDAFGRDFIQLDSFGSNLYLGNTGAASTVQIGNTTGAVAQTINLGNNSTGSSTNTVNIGSTVGSSATTIQAGTGNLTLNTNSASASIIAKSTTNNSSAFQIQNSAGIKLFNVNTAAYNTNNLIANPSIETALGSDWTGRNGTTAGIFATQSTAQVYDAAHSLNLDTIGGNATNAGATNAASLANSTSYTLSVYAIAQSGNSFSTFEIGYGSGGTDTSCLTAQAVSDTGWTRYTCTFVTGTLGGSPYIYVKQTDSANRSYYIDAVTLETTSNASSNYRNGQISLGGSVSSPLILQNSSNATTAFAVQNVAGTNVLIADTTNGRVGINKAPTQGALDVNGLIYQNGNTVCDTGGNCVGTGGGGSIGGGGTAGKIAVFTGSGFTVGDSVITQSGGTISVGGNTTIASGQSFTAAGNSVFKDNSNSSTAFVIQNSGAADTLLTADTTARGAGGGNLIKVGNSTGTDADTTILVLDSASAVPTSNLGALNGGLFYNTGNNHIDVIENGAVKELCNKTDLACGSAGATPTLAAVYAAGASQTDSTLALDATRLGLIIKDNATPISGSLFTVQNSGGGTKYLDINTTTVAVTDNLTVSGTYNTDTINSSTLTFGAAGAASIDAASSQNLNVGTGASSHTTTVGSTNGSSTTTIQSGTGNINLTTNGSSAGTIVKSGTNSATAFEVLDSSNVAQLKIDTANSFGSTFQLGATASSNIKSDNVSPGIPSLTLTSASNVIALGDNTDDVEITGGAGGIVLESNTNVASSSSLATKQGTTYTTAGSANNVAISTASLYRLDTSGAAQTITGIAAGRDGQILTLVSADATLPFSLVNLSGSSLAANQISTGTGASVSVPAGSSITLIYDATSSLWRVNGAVAGSSGSGVTAIGTLDSQTKSADGAVISGNTIVLQTADDTSGGHPGLVSTGSQSFVGAKTFDALLTGSAGLTVSGGAVSLTGNTNSSLTTTSGTLSLQGAGATSLTTTAVTSGTSAAITISTGNGTSTGVAGNISIDTGTTTSGTPTISIGTVNASAVSIGRSGITTTNNGALTVTQTLTANGGISVGSGQNISYAGGSANFDQSASSGSFATGSGTVSLNGNSTVANGKTFTAGGAATFKDNSNSATAFVIQNSGAADTLLTADTTARGAGGGNLIKVGNSTGTDTDTTILVLDGASSVPTSNLSALSGGLFYNTGNNHIDVIENGAVKELCNKTDLGCGSAGATPTLAAVYAAGASQTDSTIGLDSTRLGVLIRDNATPIAATLFGVQNSSGATKYLDVTTSGIAVAGAVTASGNINTTGGALQTNSSTRVDNSGNLTNIGNLTTTGASTFTSTGSNGFTFKPGTDNATAFQIQNNAGSSNLLIANTSTNRIGIDKAPTLGALDVNGSIYQSGNQVCDTSNNCVGVGGGGAIGGSGTANTIALFTGSGNTIGNSNLAQSGSVVTATGDLNVTGQYKVGGTQISSANLSNDSNLAKLNGTGPQTFTGDNKFSGTVLAENSSNSTTSFQIQNSTAGALLTADTTNMRLGVDVTYTALATPTNVCGGGGTCSPSAGGSLTAGVYKYKITAIDSLGGETAVSSEVTCTTASTNLTCPLTWDAVTGASGYRIYRTASGGGTGTETYLTTALTNSYNDTGSLTLSSNTMPLSSTLAYSSATNSNNDGQVVIGGNGTPTGQLYISGNIPTLVGSITNGLSSPAGGIYTQGRYAYVTSYSNNTLVIYDISNPASPTKIGSISSSLDSPKAVSVQGHYAYVLGSSTKLSVFDISNPASPSLVGNTVDLATSGNTLDSRSLYVQGRYAYAADYGDSKIIVYDISNPASPTVVGAADTSFAFPNSVFVQGRYAYIVGSTTLDIRDISNPASPSLAGSYTAGVLNQATGIYVQGRYAYITDTSNHQLAILDISNPASITSVSTIGTGLTTPNQITLQGRYVYLTDYTTNKLAVFDVSNPASPVSVGSTTSGLNAPYGLTVQGRYAYVINHGSSSLAVFDLGGTYSQQLAAGGAEFGTLAVNSNASFGGDAAIQGGLQIGQNIQAAGNLGVTGGASIQGNTILAGSTTSLGAPQGSVSVVRTGGANNSKTWSYVVTAVNAYGGETPSSATGTISTGSNNLTNVIYNTVSWNAVSGASGYRIYRVTAGGSGPTSTGFIGATSSTSFNDYGFGADSVFAPNIDSTGGLTAKGSALFADATSSTTAFQIQNPSAAQLFTADTTNMRLGVNVSYTAMATPTNVCGGGGTCTPSAGGSLTAGAYKYKITAIDSVGGETAASSEVTCTTASSNLICPLTWNAVTGASAYRIYRTASGGGSGTENFLVTVLTNSYNDDGSLTLSTSFMPLSNTLAYTSSNNSNNNAQLVLGGNGTPAGQLYVSGTTPTIVGSVSTASDANNGVFVEGRYAYVTSKATNKLSIYDISNPASPILVGSTTSTLDNPVSVQVQGRYAYVLGLSGKLSIINISNPASLSVVGNTLNVSSNGGSTGSRALTVQGRYAYATIDDSNHDVKLLVFDIANPAAPIIVGQLETNGPRDLYVQGRYAYIADPNNISMIDLSNPAAPTLAGSSSSTLTQGWGIYVQGRYAYVTDAGASKLLIYDVSNPSSITVVGSTTTGLSTPDQVYVQGRYAYVTDSGNNKLAVFDVSNPASPLSAGSTTTGLSTPGGLFIQGRYAYVPSPGNNRLAVFDLGGTYSQQLEAGGAEVGTLAVDSNANFAGDANVQGGLNVGQNIQAAGNLGVTGGAVIQGGTIIGGGNNTIGAPSGAVTVTPTCGSSCTFTWSYVITAVNAYGGESVASSTGTTAVGKNNLSLSNFNAISWSAVSGAAGYRIYRTAHGSSPSTNGYIGTASTNSFTDYGFLADTSSTAPTVDTTGQLTVRGSALFANTVNSVNAFQIQNSSANSVFNVDTSGSIVSLGKASAVTGTLTFYNSGSANGVSLVAGVGSNLTITLPTAAAAANNYCLVGTTGGALSFVPCGAGATKTVTLAPEFAGAVMTGDGSNNTGTMTSDFCSGSSRQNLNAGVCTGATESHNYYSWTSTGANDYDIWVRWQTPSDFATFNAASFYGWKTASGDSVTMNVYNNSASTCASQAMSSTTGSWVNQAITMTGCTPSAGDVLTIDIHVAVSTNADFARIGEIGLTYNRN